MWFLCFVFKLEECEGWRAKRTVTDKISEGEQSPAAESVNMELLTPSKSLWFGPCPPPPVVPAVRRPRSAHLPFGRYPTIVVPTTRRLIPVKARAIL